MEFGAASSGQPRPLYRLVRERRRRNNTLYRLQHAVLILPWVQVSHLASHILGRIATALPATGSSSTAISTCRDLHRSRRFAEKKTCYRAANWNCSGSHRRGKDDMTHRANVL